MKIPRESEFSNRVDRGRIKVGRKIAGEETATAACCAALFDGVQPSTGHQPRLFIPFRTGVISSVWQREIRRPGVGMRVCKNRHAVRASIL